MGEVSPNVLLDVDGFLRREGVGGSGEWLLYDKLTWLDYLVMGEHVGLVLVTILRVGKKWYACFSARFCS